jgi:superfamily I DNA and/or RNA helicase
LCTYRKKVKCIRLGHPARVSEELQRHSLEALIATSEETALVRDIYAEIDALGKRGKRPEAGLEKIRFFYPAE